MDMGTVRVLYANRKANYPLLLGGVARVIHEMFHRLARDHGFVVQALCSFPPAEVEEAGGGLERLLPAAADAEILGVRAFERSADRWLFDLGYPSVVERGFEESLARMLDTFRPDVLLSSQDLRLGPLLEVARAAATPVLWYRQSAMPLESDDLECLLAYTPTIATVSQYCRKVLAEVGLEASVVPPLIEHETIEVTPEPGGAVTLLHADASKGLWTFLQTAAMLPELPFLLGEGWPVGGPARTLLQEALEKVPNVELVPRTADPRALYRRTRILLVPSLVPDAAPRVIREAQWSGIPVLGSAVGGIPEILGEGGELVEDVENAEAWAERLLDLWNDPDRYAALSGRARANARRPELAEAAITAQLAGLLAATAGRS